MLNKSRRLHLLNVFTEYSNDVQDVYKNMEEYNIVKKGKKLIVFDDMIADMVNDKKLHPVVTFILFLLHNHTLRCQKMLP